MIGTGGEDTPVTPRAYQSFSTLVTAPPGAATATISLQPTGSATWVDDVSLRVATLEGATTTQPEPSPSAR